MSDEKEVTEQNNQEIPKSSKSNLGIMIAIFLGTIFGIMGLSALLSSSPEVAGNRGFWIAYTFFGFFFAFINFLSYKSRQLNKK